MKRRAFITVLGGGIFAGPLVEAAQLAGRVPRIGVLVPAEPELPNEPNVAALRRGLRDLGYIDGQNIAVEYRWAHGHAERYSALAAELVRLDFEAPRPPRAER
jgi:putative ABC transport system substrate-binding protein